MSHVHLGKWWHRDTSADRIVCDLCPRQCSMKEGDRGFCFVRKIEGNQMVLDTYGRSTGFCVDPIEKKPLNHFYPGTSVLSFGTAGCNLGCQFCQNWDISKSREVAKLSAIAEPELIANAAKELGCKSVAYTYNDPVIWAEYAIDTAKACRAIGVQSVAVTAGYMSAEARSEFYQHMDAANVDLKAFTEEFYRKITYSRLEPVLDTLRYLKHETDVWFEITNLVIPDANDSPDELKRMCDWILSALGPDVPVHFSAFHPDFRMMDRPRTSPETLLTAYAIAKSVGLHYPYVGNIHDVAHGSTYCCQCGTMLIERDWYQLGRYGLKGNLCGACGATQAGRFDSAPGDWGRKRLPVNLESFRRLNPQIVENRVSLATSLSGSASVVIKPSANAVDSMPSSPNEEAMTSPTLSTPIKLEMLKTTELSEEQKTAIHRAAQLVVVAAVCNRSLTKEWLDALGPMADQHVMGMFTTLSRGTQLRGCCGFVGRPAKLAEAIVSSAERTAKDDVRMPAVSPTELSYLNLDVSILGSPVVLTVPANERIDHIQIGTHGLKITRGQQAGLLLPSVPVEQKWSVQEFLEGVCRKAGLPENAWKESDTVLETFEGTVLEGKMETECLPSEMPRKRPPGNSDSLMQLKKVATQNLIALSRGATPTYFAAEAMDGNVNGLVLSIINSDTKTPLAHWIRTSLRNDIPLQSSLFELCKAAADVLSKTRFEKETDIELEITVLFDTVHHGVISHDDWNGNALKAELGKCEMEGFKADQRAIVTLCGDRVAVAFDAARPTHMLVQDASATVRTRRMPIGVYSLACMSTANALLASNITMALVDEAVRKPAVADAFYPASLDSRKALVSKLHGSVTRKGSAKLALALMTPHAGLQYSGQIAMDVWSSVKLPSTLLMIGPKHTSLGSDWAVSPSQAWELPGGPKWATDSELAKKIVENVEGFELDAAAHMREHGIEIQLPILEEITAEESRPKLVAIAIRGASQEEIMLAAEQLAGVLRELPEKPLLVISSDMNHYAPEAENRRRDRLAIDAMLTGDPKKLIEVCMQNQISMCGLVPAAIVLQTLILLGEPFKVEEISYDNSASGGGDPQRVVGYAGVVIRSA